MKTWAFDISVTRRRRATAGRLRSSHGRGYCFSASLVVDRERRVTSPFAYGFLTCEGFSARGSSLRQRPGCASRACPHAALAHADLSYFDLLKKPSPELRCSRRRRRASP